MILIIALIFFRDTPGCAVISEHDPSTQSFCMRLVRLVRWLRLFEPFDATIVTIHNILKAVRNDLKRNPTFCRRVALRASPPGGRNGTKISLKKYEHIIEESILQNIDFWQFGCAGEKQTPVSEAWSGQRPRCSWNLGIVPGLRRTLEVWGFGRWWGVRNWFKTQPFLALLSSQKRQQWKCRCIVSCVGQVASKRCPVTRWASKA